MSPKVKQVLSAVLAATISVCTALAALNHFLPPWLAITVGAVLVAAKDVQAYLANPPTQSPEN